MYWVKRKKNKLIIMLTTLGLGTGLFGCVAVAPYQKMYLNDENMSLKKRKIESFETNFQTYREGASGANGGKTGGGCGCN